MKNQSKTADNIVDPFLNEEFLRKLEQLRILAQKRLKGANIAEHTSWQSGGSLEFLDYRKYQLGDDLRYVDWNVFGRLDKLFIKLFQAEKDLPIHILVDMSLSMRAGDPAKDIYVKKIAAALSYIGLANLDRVGITSFGRSLYHSRAPERGRQVYLSILEFLRSLETEGETNLNQSLSEFASSGKQAGIAIILSDLLDPAGIETGLKALAYGKFDIVLIQVLDREELSPQLDGYLKLEDIETGKRISLTLNGTLLEQYRKRMGHHLEQIKEFCLERGVDYYLTHTNIPFEDFLLDFLTRGTFIH